MFSSSEILDILGEVDAGASHNSISKKYGISMRTLSRWVKNHRMALEEPHVGGDMMTKTTNNIQSRSIRDVGEKAVEREQIIRELRDGMGVTACSRKYGTSMSQLYRWKKDILLSRDDDNGVQISNHRDSELSGFGVTDGV
jgi:transposase-like protein